MFRMQSRMLSGLILAATLVGCAGASDELDPNESSEREFIESVSQALQTSDVTFPVTVRGTGSATIHAVIYTNSAISSGETAIAVHGLTGTGNNWDQLAPALFADKLVGKKLKRVVGIDFIGHGKSGFPQNLPNGTFGQLAIEDNVSVLIQSIQQLRARQLAPTVIFAHSMGGLAVQAAQQALLNQNSSLAALGINKAVLFAPVPPRDRPWVRPPSGDVTPFIVTSDPVLGPYLSLPPGVGGSFVTLAGTVVPNAPTNEQILARGYLAIEPFVTLAQLGGAPIPLPTGGSFILPLPTVSAGVFAPSRGTVLALVSFSQDVLVPASNLPDLYTYLTGDTRQTLYVPIVASDAVHSMIMSNAPGLLSKVRALF
jgi:pimeloyl-ACP methyl ester carboxylesterase